MRDDRTPTALDVAVRRCRASALTLPRVARDSPVFFVRCELLDAAGALLAENIYWQSQQRDDVGDPRNDQAFELRQVCWADMTALNPMPRAPLEVSARAAAGHGRGHQAAQPGPTRRILRAGRDPGHRDGDEILPVQYTDNYVTVFPGETVEIRGTALDPSAAAGWVRVSGYNTAPVLVPVR